MATLDSTSTWAEVVAAYADNVGYDEDNSATKARAFVTACRLLLSPAMSSKRTVHGGRGGGEELELDLAEIRRQLEAAQNWITGNASGGGVRHLSVEEFRT